MSVIAATPHPRGTELLLWHCGVISRPPVADRLRDELGGDFSRRLVAALVQTQRTERRRRGSSSP